MEKKIIPWGVSVDIEGFSQFYVRGGEAEYNAIQLLSGLMQDLYRLGSRVYHDDYERLFIYQLGDGFLITPCVGDTDLRRALAIGTALLQSTALREGFAKAGISTGDIADISGCYPKEVTQARQEEGCISIGEGLMLIFPVMGTALIRSWRLTQGKPKGPHLLVDESLIDYVKQAQFPILGHCENCVILDWPSTKNDQVKRILESIERPIPRER